MLTKARLKTYGAIVSMLLFGGLLYFYEVFSSETLRRNQQLVADLKEIDSLDARLNVLVLENNYSLFQNFDPLEETLKTLQAKTSRLEKNNYIQEHFSGAVIGIFRRFRQDLSQKKEQVQRFKTYIAPLKIARLYARELLVEYQKKFHTNSRADYLSLLLGVANSMQLANRDTSQDHLRDLREQAEKLTAYQFQWPGLKTLHNNFLEHTKVFINYYPLTRDLVNGILNAPTNQLLTTGLSELKKQSASTRRVMSLLSYLLTLGFLTTVGVNIYLLMVTDRENKKLVRLQNMLEWGSLHDGLTGLRNRVAFNRDWPRMKSPALILVNIDSFKQINDFYGTRAGDSVLVETGLHLETELDWNSDYRVYRLGADDFGILTEETSDLIQLTRDIITSIEKKTYTFQDARFTLNVSAGIALGDQLLEKADMALKHIKNGSRLKYLVYDEDLDIATRFEQNLRALRTVKTALDEDQVFPVYMPIMNNRNGRIYKYECLMRIRDKDNKIVPPGQFLPVARSSKLYGSLTRVLFRKSFHYFMDKEVDFNINLSLEDLLDQDVVQFIFDHLEEFPHMARRLTFEILEGEDIENYDKVFDFTYKVRQFGCRIAIDDFGSGYSNFHRIMDIGAHYLKLDGSLVRELEKSDSSQAAMIVETVIEFARRADIRTVAEFVSNENIARRVRELGIDYSQGFFYGKPIDDIPGEKT